MISLPTGVWIPQDTDVLRQTAISISTIDRAKSGFCKQESSFNEGSKKLQNSPYINHMKQFTSQNLNT